MFDASLSCRAFALSGHNAETYLDLARTWSGQESLEASENGVIHWSDRTKIDVADYKWCSAPPSFDAKVQNALIRLGRVENTEIFVFVSPFTSVSAAFRTATERYIGVNKEKNREISSVDLRLDLNRFVEEKWDQFAHQIHSIQSTTASDESGVYAVLTDFSKNPLLLAGLAGQPLSASQPRPLSAGRPRLPGIRAVQIYILDQLIEIDNNFKIELLDVSLEFAEVASCLTAAFRLFRDYLSLKKEL